MGADAPQRPACTCPSVQSKVCVQMFRAGLSLYVELCCVGATTRGCRALLETGHCLPCLAGVPCTCI